MRALTLVLLLAAAVDASSDRKETPFGYIYTDTLHWQQGSLPTQHDTWVAGGVDADTAYARLYCGMWIFTRVLGVDGKRPPQVVTLEPLVSVDRRQWYSAGIQLPADSTAWVMPRSWEAPPVQGGKRQAPPKVMATLRDAPWIRWVARVKGPMSSPGELLPEFQVEVTSYGPREPMTSWPTAP